MGTCVCTCRSEPKKAKDAADPPSYEAAISSTVQITVSPAVAQPYVPSLPMNAFPEATLVPMSPCLHKNIQVNATPRFPFFVKDGWKIFYALSTCGDCNAVFVSNFIGSDMWTHRDKVCCPHPRSALQIKQETISKKKIRQRYKGSIEIERGFRLIEGSLDHPQDATAFYARAECMLCQRAHLPVITFGTTPL